MTGIRAFMTNKMKVDLRACGFLDDPKLIERMTDEAIAASEAGHNVYIEGRTVRRGLSGKQRGELKDTVAVFALVVDSDADKNEAWTPTAPVSLSVESSPGNAHSWFFFERALDSERGRELGERTARRH